MFTGFASTARTWTEGVGTEHPERFQSGSRWQTNTGMTAVCNVHEPSTCHSSTDPQQETMFGTSRAGRKLRLSNSDQFRDLRVAWITRDGWAVLRARSWGISSVGTFQLWTEQFVIFSFWLTLISLPAPPKKDSETWRLQLYRSSNDWKYSSYLTILSNLK